MVSTVVLSPLEDDVRTITLRRPEKLNTINDALTRDLLAALHEVDRDPDCHAVILTGAGRAFCAGLDLSGYGDDDLVEEQGRPRRFYSRQQEIASISQRIHHLRQPVIAAINGACAGGGLAFALACDIRIASAESVFACGFLRAGYSGCDLGSSWFLPRIVGTGRAHELMLTGRRFDADEALAIGLVTDVVAPGEVMAAARATADRIRLNAPWSVELTKEGMWAALEIPSVDAMIRFENRQQVLTSFAEDQPEAVASFLEKRPPRYRYR